MGIFSGGKSGSGGKHGGGHKDRQRVPAAQTGKQPRRRSRSRSLRSGESGTGQARRRRAPRNTEAPAGGGLLGPRLERRGRPLTRMP
jgi:hypothetical protein